MTLNNIAWGFSSKFYIDSEEFNQDIIEYQKRIFKNAKRWNPSEIVFYFPELEIQYMAWVTKPSDLLENETLINDDKDVFEKNHSIDKYCQVEITAKLKADNGKNFTALEFLIKTHNQQANKYLGDHRFFEGIDENPKIINGLPNCYIVCGS